MQLLQDVFIVENLQVLTEGKTNPTMKIKGIFGRCNEKNNNGRIYPTAVLEGQLNKVQPMINERRLCGELDHPSNDTVKLANASHLITKLEMKGDELIGEAELLNTPAGLTAKALVEGGVKIGISSRGMGTLSEDANGQKIVNEDFRLVTFDLVADPSTRGAFPGLSESTESKFVQESQNKLKKESNFVTMLEARLRESYDPWIEEARKSKKKKKAKKKKGKLDPVGKEDADVNNDGKVDGTDGYLRNRRRAIGAAMGKKKMMEAVRDEGSWHQIAFALAEAFGLVSEGEVKRRNKQLKNKAMGRGTRIPERELADREVHDHGSNAETVGRLRGVKKKKGAKKKDELFNKAGPVGKLPDHTEYQKIGDLMAEALGLVEMNFNDPNMSPGEVRKLRYKRANILRDGGRISGAEASALKREALVGSTAAEKKKEKEHLRKESAYVQAEKAAKKAKAKKLKGR